MDTTNGMGIPDSLYAAIKGGAPHEPPAAEKRTYIEIHFDDGGRCVCSTQEEVDVMTEGSTPGSWRTESVEMTEADYDQLPEFEG